MSRDEAVERLRGAMQFTTSYGRGYFDGLLEAFMFSNVITSDDFSQLSVECDAYCAQLGKVL